MTRVLFWNLNKRSLDQEVAALAKDKAIDLILLAEAGGAPDSYRQSLGYEIPAEPFESPFTLYGVREKTRGKLARLHILVRNSKTFWTTLYEDQRFVIATYEPPTREGILLAVAHLQSQADFKRSSIGAECRRFTRFIREQESSLGTTRTVVVGDLNLDPFDEGIIGADGLHGMASRQLAKKGGRTISGENYSYFYNPMWNLFGDHRGAPGSYYYYSAESNTQFWHIFDQVLVRPDLASEFSDGSLEFLTEIRGETLLRKDGTPNDGRFSDHLPLTFELKLKAKK